MDCVVALRAPRNDGAEMVAVIARSGATKQSNLTLGVMMKQPAVYIMASKRNGTLYTGVTSNLQHRAWQHREAIGTGFAAHYACTLLVWYELHDTMLAAIAREKTIKGGSRARKIALITTVNPE
jgi:putative endonuclease